MFSLYGDCGALRRPATVGLLALLFLLMVCGQVLAQDPVERKWGLGWDDGLTARAWLGGKWELALAAGPDDYLQKEETRSWLLRDSVVRHGQLEVPLDVREEHGWVRFQVGRLIKTHGDFAVTGYTGVVFEWINHQARSLELDDLLNDYNTFELDRHTRRWIMTLGLRPSWQPTSFLTIETAFGLNFMTENWDQETVHTWAGVEGRDREDLDGHGQEFKDFGFSGAASIQIFIWL